MSAIMLMLSLEGWAEGEVDVVDWWWAEEGDITGSIGLNMIFRY